jgi:sec-independent protein translocase protein TatA
MLNNIGPSGLILIAVVTLVLFGRGKIGGLMGEMGSGIKAFRKGLREGEAKTPALTDRPGPDEPDA